MAYAIRHRDFADENIAADVEVDVDGNRFYDGDPIEGAEQTVHSTTCTFSSHGMHGVATVLEWRIAHNALGEENGPSWYEPTDQPEIWNALGYGPRPGFLHNVPELEIHSDPDTWVILRDHALLYDTPGSPNDLYWLETRHIIEGAITEYVDYTIHAFNGAAQTQLYAFKSYSPQARYLSLPDTAAEDYPTTALPVFEPAAYHPATDQLILHDLLVRRGSDGKRLALPTGLSRDGLAAFEFDQSGSTLIATSSLGAIWSFDPTTGNPRHSFQPPVPSSHMAIADGGDWLILADASGRLISYRWSYFDSEVTLLPNASMTAADCTSLLSPDG